MVIGFLGKGGSGKSTLATAMVHFLHNRGNTVLAVDADHNMDLSYNLGHEGGPYIGTALADLYSTTGLTNGKTWRDMVRDAITSFSLSPADVFTKDHTATLAPDLFLMAAGEQTEAVRHGITCSHSLATPLKAYLPLLRLNENEFVVVDEKASVDAVTTGIPTGFDLAVITVEPREHSVRVGKQIAEELARYDVPFVVVLNKSRSVDDTRLVTEMFKRKPFATLSNTDDPLTIANIHKAVFEQIAKEAETVSTRNLSRLVRSQKKITFTDAFSLA